MPTIYLIFLLFICGCNSRGIPEPKIEKTSLSNSQFSLSGDLNVSKIPSFQSVIKIDSLKPIISRALLKNPDWKVQLAKVELIRVNSGILSTDSEPRLNAQIGFSQGKENTRESGFTEQSIPSWNTGALFNWEMDLWGKWKFIKQSSIIHIQEAEYIKEAAKLTFIHEITGTWLLLCALKTEMQILEKATLSQEKSMEYYRKRVDSGLDSDITYERQKIAYEQLRLEQAKVLRKFETTRIRLGSLLGNPLDPDLPEIKKISQIELPSLPKVFPAQAMKNIPFLQEKEAKLKENLLLKESSKYDLYPNLTFRMSSISLGSDLSAPFKQWKASFGPVFNLPVWSPRKKLGLKIAESQVELYKEEWNASINSAIEEIEFATKSFVMSLREHSIAVEASKNFAKVYAFTNDRLRAGLVSQLQLLEDERQFLRIQRDELSTRLQVFQFALDLSKSLGLRWEE